MADRQTVIRFYFDYLSPYAYLAWTQVHALAAQHGRAVEPTPVLLAGLLGAHGTKGPAEVPAKRSYIFKDVMRTARLLGVPLVPPPTHPFNPLLALRVSGLPMDEAVRRRLIDALFDATWAGGRGVEDPTEVAAIADRVGLDGRAAVAEAQAPPSKERLRRHTEEAIAAGAFGVPTMLVDGELFWGYDSLGHVERQLAGEDPLDAQLLARWSNLPASASRKLS